MAAYPNSLPADMFDGDVKNVNISWSPGAKDGLAGNAIKLKGDKSCFRALGLQLCHASWKNKRSNTVWCYIIYYQVQYAKLSPGDRFMTQPPTLGPARQNRMTCISLWKRALIRWISISTWLWIWTNRQDGTVSEWREKVSWGTML